MKTKRILFLSFLLATGTLANAQQITIMPKLGTDIYYMTTPKSVQGMSQKPAAGFTGGAAIDIKIHKWFSIQTEFLYITKGYSSTYTFTDSSGNKNGSQTDKYTFSYIQIPILAKANYSKGNFKMYATGGASFDYGIGGSCKISQSGYSLSGIPSSGKTYFENYPSSYTANGFIQYFTKSSFNRSDISLQFGGGIGYKVGIGTITFDARYGLGLINFYKKAVDNYYQSTDLTSKYRMLSLTVGYAIPLGK